MSNLNFKPLGLGQLTRMCQVIRWLLLAFLLIQIGFFILSWIIPMPLKVGPLHIELDPDGMAAGSVHNLSLVQQTLGVVIGLPGLLALSYGINRLGRALAGFQTGKIFAMDTISQLRAAAASMLFSTVLFNIEKPLRGIAFNLAGNGRTYPVVLEVATNELLLILVCSLFYLIAGVMHEGRRLSEENEGFI